MPAAPGSHWAALAGLEFTIESVRFEQRTIDIGRERISTLVILEGEGHTGIGEDVTYQAGEHAPELIGRPAVTGKWKLADYCDFIGAQDLFPQTPPEAVASRSYRRWAWESAALDLALRQAGSNIAVQLGLTPKPVHFVSSARVQQPGEEPSLDLLAGLLDAVPDLRFKLDADSTWSDAFLEELAAFGRVDCIDFKGYYVGTIVDVDISPERTLAIARALPGATCEDVAPGRATELVAAEMPERLAWDAPIHSWADVEALPIKPSRMNIKPSRIGSIKETLTLCERLAADGVAMYGGGQFELGVGRGQAILLASMLYPDAANDLAPTVFHAPAPGTALPSSPLRVPDGLTGFRWPGEG